MHDVDETIAALGNEPPLIADGRSGPPDRREISARWLSGTFLTGLTSSVLMGVALMAALDGREILATPPEIAELSDMNDGAIAGEAAKTRRLDVLRPLARAKDRRRMEVSTVSRVGDRDVIRTMPFVQVRMALAANHTTSRSYPAFDPLDVFAEDGAVQTTTTTGQIYGAKVESELSVKTVEFPMATASFEERSELSADEVEEVVRLTGAVLTEGDVQVAALHYVDPQRFGATGLTAETILASYGVRIVPENVSVSSRIFRGEPDGEFAEEIVAITEQQELADAFTGAGYVGDDATAMAGALSRLLNSKEIRQGSVLRIGSEVTGDQATVVRASIYDGTNHLLTVALNDRSQFVPASEPEAHPGVAAAFDTSPPAMRARGDLPSVYDGIFRAAYSYGLSRTMTQNLVKLLASDVDFQSRLNPADRLEVLFSQPDEDDKASDESDAQLLPLPDGRRRGRLFRRRRPFGAPVPAAQSRAQRQVPVRFRHASPSDPGVQPHAHRRRLVGTARHAHHRLRQRRRAGRRLGQRLRTADDHQARQRLRYLLFAPERDRQGRRARSACSAGAGDRLCGRHRHGDRRPSALRTPRQRRQGRSDARSPSHQPGAEGRRARGFQARARAHR
jgi:hypothetical protein